MDTLVRLNEQGRMVGIISHVSELKEQIPKQLQVISGRSGSRVSMVC
jgi:exonuclease SbcC